MDSKCLRWLRYGLSTLDGWGILYRIGAGFCSIIVGWAYQSLKRNNRQLARVFFMPVHNHSREVVSLRKISCWIFIHYFINN